MAEKYCSIDDCSNKNYAKGLCEKHYTRVRRHGTPGFTARREPVFGTLEQKFMTKFTQGGEECWLWNGNLDKDGYGFMMHYGKVIKAHRYAYILHNGEVAEGNVICHSCDVRDCVNPHHLFEATQSENIADCINKGRHITQTKVRIIK